MRCTVLCRAWTPAAKKSSKLLIASQGLPSCTRMRKAPEAVAGPMMSSTVGAICAVNTCNTFVPSMPASTLVSQSGPATSMDNCVMMRASERMPCSRALTLQHAAARTFALS